MILRQLDARVLRDPEGNAIACRIVVKRRYACLAVSILRRQSHVPFAHHESNTQRTMLIKINTEALQAVFLRDLDLFVDWYRLCIVGWQNSPLLSDQEI